MFSGGLFCCGRPGEFCRGAVDALIQVGAVIVGDAEPDQWFGEDFALRAEQQHCRETLYFHGSGEGLVRGGGTVKSGQGGFLVDVDLPENDLGLVIRVPLHGQQEFAPRALAPRAAGFTEQDQQRPFACRHVAPVGGEVAGQGQGGGPLRRGPRSGPDCGGGCQGEC